MKIEVRYSWRTKWAGRMVTSRIKMTEDRARANDPAAVRIDSSREEIVVYDQPAELLFYGAAPGFSGPKGVWPAVLCYPCGVPGPEGKVPLRGTPGQYQVTQDGDVWTVVQTGEPQLLMYRGAGPVSVEAAP